MVQHKSDFTEQSRLTHTVFFVYPLFMQGYLIVYHYLIYLLIIYILSRRVPYEHN